VRSASAQSQRKGATAPCSWTPEESEVESYEHQDNANIHCQPFPESVSEEHEIHTNYDGYHRYHVKHDSYLFAHFSTTSMPAWIRQATSAPAQQRMWLATSPPGLLPASRHHGGNLSGQLLIESIVPRQATRRTH
jgi:hypothetical protein